MSTAYDPRPHPGSWVENRSRIRRRWTMPLHYIEWMTRLVAYYLSHWSLLEVLEYAGRFTVLVAVVIYFMEAPDRRKQKHYQAWQVINTAQGQTGSGGRVEALEELHADGVPLVGLNVKGAYLQGLRLPNANLHRSNMEEADLRNCDLSGANLEDATLDAANFRNADLRRVKFTNASLTGSDLTGANLEGADLIGADLRNADLSDMKWNAISSISGANIHGIDNAPEGFVAWAMKNGAVSVESNDAGSPAKGSRQATTKP
jgi:hypothetical protein